MNMLLLAFVIIALVVVSGFFSGSETALTAASRARMHRLTEEGDIRAKWVTQLLLQKERLISAILLGNNLVNILASVLATTLFLDLFGESGVVYATLFMTALVVIFAEVLPKTYAISTPDQSALRVSGILRVLVWLLSPFTLALHHIAKYIMQRAGFDSDNIGHLLPAHEEIRGAIDLHHSQQAVTTGDRDMLGGILDLRQLTVGEVMIHRKNMQIIEADTPPAEIVQQVLASPYTRIPLWRDEPENIIGILHAKDLLRALAKNTDPNQLNIDALCLEAWFVPESTELGEQLSAFKARKAHFALVVDEYGALMGLITLEDILEEIVGQIDDEHDEAEPDMIPAADGSFEVEGDKTIRDLNRETGLTLPDDEATTIAGLVIHEARTIPRPGQIFVFHDIRFRILRCKRNQIKRIELRPLTTRPRRSMID